MTYKEVIGLLNKALAQHSMATMPGAYGKVPPPPKPDKLPRTLRMPNIDTTIKAAEKSRKT